MIPTRVTSPCLDMELIINDMERKVGEEFECDGVKLRVEPDVHMCKGCYFNRDFYKWCNQYKSVRGECQKASRSDIGVIFEKVHDLNKGNKQSILDEAKTIVEGSRLSDYGDPVESFERIAKIASMITGKDLSPKECCAVLMAVKMVREGYRHKRDNLVDLCGYAHIMNEINEKEKKGEQI